MLGIARQSYTSSSTPTAAHVRLSRLCGFTALPLRVARLPPARFETFKPCQEALLQIFEALAVLHHLVYALDVPVNHNIGVPASGASAV